jgi:hypothetical protein
MSVNISFGAINVNAVNRDSAIAIGENNQPGWTSHSKHNFGNGMFFGMNITGSVMNNIIDNDVIDAPVNDQDNVPGVQSQTI